MEDSRHIGHHDLFLMSTNGSILFDPEAAAPSLVICEQRRRLRMPSWTFLNAIAAPTRPVAVDRPMFRNLLLRWYVSIAGVWGGHSPIRWNEVLSRVGARLLIFSFRDNSCRALGHASSAASEDSVAALGAGRYRRSHRIASFSTSQKVSTQLEGLLIKAEPETGWSRLIFLRRRIVRLDWPTVAHRFWRPRRASPTAVF
jgi:hypothetical protein